MLSESSEDDYKESLSVQRSKILVNSLVNFDEFEQVKSLPNDFTVDFSHLSEDQKSIELHNIVNHMLKNQPNYIQRPDPAAKASLK